MAGVKGRSGMNPNSLKNLQNIPKEELARRAANGRKKAVEAVKRQKEMRAVLNDFLSMPMKAGKELEAAEAFDTAKKANLTVVEKMMMAQIKKAVDGDTKAAEFIRDTTGQKAPQQIQASVTADPLVDIMKQLQENKEEEKKEDK